MSENLLKDITIEYFQKSPIGEQIKEGLAIIEEIQQAIYKLASESEESKLASLKAGTVLIFGIVNKLSDGKNISEFTNEDWKDIAHNVIDKAILMDGRLYSELVFLTYAEYIEVSAIALADIATERKTNDIKLLATTLRSISKDLENGTISEVDYIEECLWISLEAMIKLIAVTLTASMEKEYADCIQAVTIFALQYGRLRMYQKEKQILDSYLNHQQELDEELEEEYSAFIEELRIQSAKFNDLIDDAFDSDFEDKLRGSLSLARAAGVSEEELLKDIADIDDFFL